MTNFYPHKVSQHFCMSTSFVFEAILWERGQKCRISLKYGHACMCCGFMLE